MTEEPTRKLAVLLHADVVGSTALVQLNETLAHQRIQDTFRRFSETIAHHSGIAHEIRGDALVAEFARASDAVSASLAFQSANTAHNKELPDEVRPVVRVGIAMGEVVVADNTVTGEGIVLAQRLEQLAGPGGVCIQDAAYQIVPKRLPFEYENLGEHELKGFDERLRVYAVTQKSQSALSASGAMAHLDTAPELPDKPSIAVLPFANMSGDPDQEYFSDGITEDIITELSHFSGLFVIARNSSFAYKGERIDIKRIARELGVRYVLEGSVRRAESRIRINAQLLDSTSASHLWAERFDRKIDDIFELQEEITRNIVGSIAPQIELAEVERGRALRSTNLSSYQLSLQAQATFYDALRGGASQGMERAIAIAQAALEIDPRNVHALWMQAMAYADQYLYRWGDDPDAALERAWEVAEYLIQVDSMNAHAYMSRGLVYQFRDDFDRALADFHRAFAINPNFAWNIFVMAFCESAAGIVTDAREHAKLALRLSPRDMDMWLGVAYLALTQASFAEGDFEEAKKWGLLAIQMHEKAPIRHALMIASYGHTGDLQTAARHTEELMAFAPDFIRSLLSGDMTVYKRREHNSLLVGGLRKAGLPESSIN